MGPRRLKVALDATPLAGERTGVGVFCTELLGELSLRPGLEVGAFAISRRGRSVINGRLPQGVRALGPPGPSLPARLLHRSWAHWRFPPAEAWTGCVDVVHGTNFVVPPPWSAASVVTVHDLTPWDHPEWSLPAARAYPRLVQKAVERGAWVHADSETVARRLRELFPPERVRAIYPGGPRRKGLAEGGEPSSPAQAGAGRVAEAGAGTAGGAASGTAGGTACGDRAGLAGAGGQHPHSVRHLVPSWASAYVLALGTVEPRKALPVLVRAFASIAGRHPGVALVIAGAEGWGAGELQRALEASPARERTVRLGWVGGQERDELLAGATVFAYPSLYEGFGLPPLEAMAAGAPVVASDAGALPEVLGDAALFVPAGDEEALAGALDRLLGDPQAREDLVARGARQAALYSWERCAREMEALYREAAGA